MNSSFAQCCNSNKDTIKHYVYLGIDFGTTNCLMAYYDYNKQSDMQLCFVKNSHNACNLFPSVVNLDQNGEYFFCPEAAICSENTRITKSIKRIIGMNLVQVLEIANQLPFKIDLDKSSEKEVFVYIGSTSKSVQNIVVGMMGILYQNVVKHFDNNIEVIFKSVITVPAYFDENARIIIKNAALLAGFDVIRLINEPTAAALAYFQYFSQKSCEEKFLIDEPKNVLVFDLGGGTFDISILRLHRSDFFRVIGVGGNKYLGGDDIDYLLSEYFADRASIKIDHLGNSKKNELLKASKKFKEEFEQNLCNQKKFQFIFKDNQLFEINVERILFEQIIEKFVQKTVSLMNKTILEAGIGLCDIDCIILVGGATRMHLIQKNIIEEINLKCFNNKNQPKILSFLNPDEVVVHGAAIYAASFNKENSLNAIKHNFIDAISFDLGIEVGYGLCEVIIPRNSPIPISAKQVFSTQVDNQPTVRISICQGNSNKFSENAFLAEFKLVNLPLLPAGQVKIEVSFNIDVDGILSVVTKSSDVREAYSLKILKNI